MGGRRKEMGGGGKEMERGGGGEERSWWGGGGRRGRGKGCTYIYTLRTPHVSVRGKLLDRYNTYHT